MNKENASKLWKRIQQAGDELQGKTSRSSKPSKRKKTPMHMSHMCEK